MKEAERAKRKAIILFTPTHTGTHFLRMLLEAHPQIETAIGEDFRIDSQLRDDYVLTGRGAGWVDPPRDVRRDGSSERMLVEYFRDFLAGRLESCDFVDALAYWQRITAEAKLPLRNREHHFRRVREEFQSLGIELAPKSAGYLLFRGHCHSEHRDYDLRRLTQAFPVLVTVRHPMRSILSLMRRNPENQFAAIIDSFVTGLQCVLSLEGAFLFCTDLWQGQRDKMAEVFTALDLPLESAVERFMALSPRVNYTIAKGEPHGAHNYCLAHEHTPEMTQALCEARTQLDAGACPPLLQPYLDRMERDGLLSRLERLGYTF